MSRKKSTLISLGISTALLAVGVWYLFDHFRYLSNTGYDWFAGHQMGVGGSIGGFMMIFWILVLGAIVLLIFGAFSQGRRQIKDEENATGPIQILKQRYAKGEIDKLEFEDKLENLQR